MTNVVNSITGGTIKGALIQGRDFTFAGPIEVGPDFDVQEALAEPQEPADVHVGLSGPEARQIAGVLRHFADQGANLSAVAQIYADTLTERADASRDGALLTSSEAKQIAGVLLHFASQDLNIGIVAAAQAELLTLRGFQARTA